MSVSKLICTRCHTEKPTSEFYPRGSNHYGVRQPCKECTAKLNKRDRQKPGRRERKLEVSKAYYRRPEVKARTLLKSKLRRRKDHVKYKYGLSHSDVTDMQFTACGICDICGRPFDKTPNIDHDHTTGAVRGLLCSKCNLALGLFNDNTRTLMSAVEYLQVHSL